MNAAAPSFLLLTKQCFIALTNDMLIELHNVGCLCLERRQPKPLVRLPGLPTAPAVDEKGAKPQADQNNRQGARIVQNVIDSGLFTRDSLPPDSPRRDRVRRRRLS